MFLILADFLRAQTFQSSADYLSEVPPCWVGDSCMLFVPLTMSGASNNKPGTPWKVRKLISKQNLLFLELNPEIKKKNCVFLSNVFRNNLEQEKI